MTRLPFLVLALTLLGCEGSPSANWLGYAEGEQVLVGAGQPGWVVRIAVARGAEVSAGDVLFALDDTAEKAARDAAAAELAAAEARLANLMTGKRDEEIAILEAKRGEAEAALAFAEKELARQAALLKTSAAAKRNYDQAKSERDLARARLLEVNAELAAGRLPARPEEIRAAENARDAARAALAQAEWRLAERTVIARNGGRVEDVFFRVGEYAPAGVPGVAILPPGNVFVRFFVPETELAEIALGGKVAVFCDGCPENLTAEVSFISQQAEFTPPVIFSAGSREKFVFKAEARAPGGLALRPGLPVEVRPLAE